VEVVMSEINEEALEKRLQQIEQEFDRAKSELEALRDQIKDKRNEIQRIAGQYQEIEALLEGDDGEDIDREYEKVKEGE
jgi:archaellum component FlaC